MTSILELPAHDDCNEPNFPLEWFYFGLGEPISAFTCIVFCVFSTIYLVKQWRHSDHELRILYFLHLMSGVSGNFIEFELICLFFFLPQRQVSSIMVSLSFVSAKISLQ